MNDSSKLSRLLVPVIFIFALSFQALNAQPEILAGVALKQITHFEVNPNISAMKMSGDGSTIVYATSGPEAKVYTLNTSGTGLTMVYDYQRTGYGPMIDISGDGEKVIWTDGEGEIYIANRDGSGLDELATLIPNPDTNFADLEPVIPLPPRITTDGSQVFFINKHRDPRAAGVWKVNADNSSLTQIFNYLKLAGDVFGRDGSEFEENSAFTDGFDISANGSRMIFGTRIFKLEEGDLDRGHAVFAIGTEFYDMGEYALGYQPFATDEDGENCIMYRREFNPEIEFDEVNVYYVPLGTGEPVKVIGGLDIFGTSAFTQMAADGARAITVGANGRLPISYTHRPSGYAFDLVSVDPISILTKGFRLSESSLPSINADGDRFCFLANSTPPQIWMGTILEDGASSLPKINGVRFEPPTVYKDFSATATVSAHVSDTDHPIHLVTFESFRDGFLHYRALRSDSPNNGILVDDGTSGDESAEDFRYSNGTVNVDLVETPPGEYTLRISAVNNTLEDITFVDAFPMNILEESTSVPGPDHVPMMPLTVFPNPVDDLSTITWDIAIECQVSIDLYDLMGSKVAALLNQPMSAGSYTREFDTKDLSPGIYFCTLVAGGEKFTVKIAKR